MAKAEMRIMLDQEDCLGREIMRIKFNRKANVTKIKRSDIFFGSPEDSRVFAAMFDKISDKLRESASDAELKPVDGDREFLVELSLLRDRLRKDRELMTRIQSWEDWGHLRASSQFLDSTIEKLDAFMNGNGIASYAGKKDL